MAEATDECSMIQTLLRQHDRALRARDTADMACKSERVLIADLRRDIVEMERSLARRKLEQHCPERERAVERRCEAALALLSSLRSEASEMDTLVNEATETANGLESEIKELETERVAVSELQALARTALSNVFYFDQFKRSLAVDCANADAALERTCSECEDALAKLRGVWAEQEERQRADIDECNVEIGGLQVQHDANRKKSDNIIAQQAEEWNRTLSETRSRTTSTIQRLDQQRRSKAAALREEIARAKLQKESSERLAKKREHELEAQLRVTYATKSQHAEESCKLAMDKERRFVEDAVLARKFWQQKAEKSRIAYTSHAAKSGTYMRAIGMTGRDKIMDMAQSLPR